MSSFSQRVILITGAGSGIGRQLALDLAAEGAAIAAVDRQADLLARLQADLSGRKVAIALADVTDRPALQAAVGQLEEHLGPIDILIANAGIGKETSAAAYKAEDVEAMIQVNLIGVSNSIGAVLPGMLQRRQGHLVGISSLASYRGMPKMAGYSASKAGVNALLDSLRVELGPQGIAVTTICPGFIRTPLTQHLADAGVPMLEVDDAARRIVEAVRRRKAFCAFPANGVRRVRLLCWLPSTWSDWLVRRYQHIYDRKQES